MDIKSAILSLDRKDDANWTADGAPRVDVISALVGKEVKRAEITDAYPGFNRAMENDDGTAKNDEPDASADDSASDGETSADADADDAPDAVDGDDETDEGDVTLDEIEFDTYTVDDIKNMSVRELVADRELLAEAIRVADLDAAAKTATFKEAKAAMEAASKFASKLRNVQAQATKGENPNLEYIRAQNQVRADRAARAQAFVAAGTTPKEVAKALSTRSPIDQAMINRKAGRGTQRPVRTMK